MNILLDSLPETVEFDGKEYFMDCDFRTCIIFEKILADESINTERKLAEIFCLFFPEGGPPDLIKSLDMILHHYSCGDVKPQKQTKKMNGNVVLKEQQIYNYDYDAPYIYAAFLSQYQIDLNEIEYLHWWKFQALFRALESRNKIVEIMSYRAADLSKITSKSEKQRIAKMKSLYALPSNLTFEDKVAMAGAAFGGS